MRTPLLIPKGENKVQEAVKNYVQKEIDHARTVFGNQPIFKEIIAGIASAYADIEGRFRREMLAVIDNTDLTVEARHRDAKYLKSQFIDETEKALAKISESFNTWREKYDKKTKPQPPVDDPVLLEAKLANARADIRMMFENTTPAELPLAVYHGMGKFTEDMQYLMFGTNWAETYFHSRGVPETAQAIWEAKHEHALPLMLNSEQTEQLEAIQRTEKALKVAFPRIMDEADGLPIEVVVNY